MKSSATLEREQILESVGCETCGFVIIVHKANSASISVQKSVAGMRAREGPKEQQEGGLHVYDTRPPSSE